MLHKKPLLIIVVLLMFFQVKSQNNIDTSAYLKFICTQHIYVFLDSVGMYQLSNCWEKDNSIMVLDAYGNRIKIYKEGKTEILTLGTKTRKYKDIINEHSYVHNWDYCTDNDGKKCSIRIIFPPDKDFGVAPLYMFIDYKNVTYGYQLFFLKNN